MKRFVFIVMCLLVVLNTYGQKKKTTTKVAKSYTIEQALEYVEDYFSFYEADTAMRIQKQERFLIMFSILEWMFVLV